jgi:mRNA-degrading endonuclease RelE of RelBE toxin-antitoxin system
MTYSYILSPELDRVMKKLRKKDPVLHERVVKKVLQIVEKPELYKTLSHVGGRYKRAHIDPFVLIFTIEEDTVRFLYLERHDKVYRKLK